MVCYKCNYSRYVCTYVATNQSFQGVFYIWHNSTNNMELMVSLYSTLMPERSGACTPSKIENRCSETMLCTL